MRGKDDKYNDLFDIPRKMRPYNEIIYNMVNFKDKNMAAVIDKALDFIGGMNTSEPVPQSMDESTAKGILKYLKELGVPATPADVAARGQQQGWSAGFTDKVAEWAERVAAGERLVIKHPEFFSTYMREELRALV